MKQQQKKITNIEHLTDDLVNTYEEVRTGRVSESQAKQAANVAGKIINAAKTHLDYNRYMKVRRKIKFLDA